MARLAKSLETLRDQVDEIATNRNTSNDGWIGDEGHAARTSDHNPDVAGVVHALDITKDPAHGVDVQKIAENIIAAADKRVKYLIHAGRIANPDIQNWKWRAVTRGRTIAPSICTSPSRTSRRSRMTSPRGQCKGRSRAARSSRNRSSSAATMAIGSASCGDFGEATEAAVRAFQEHHALVIDGIVGRYT